MTREERLEKQKQRLIEMKVPEEDTSFKTSFTLPKRSI